MDASRWSGREYLVQGDTRVTFAGLTARVAECAELPSLANLDLGARTLLLADGSVSWVVAFWTCISRGCTVILGNTWWSDPVLAHAVEDSDPSLIITDQAARPWDRLAPSRGVIDVATFGREVSGTHDTPSFSSGGEDEPCAVIFTAGTTGYPKGAVMSHRALIANVHAMLQVSKRLPEGGSGDRSPDVTLVTSPLFHIGGVQGLLLSLVYGGKVVFLEGRFRAENVLNAIERERVTIWGAIPTMASRVVEALNKTPRDVSSMRSISLGGATATEGLRSRVLNAFHVTREPSVTYGMTEAGGTITLASAPLLKAHPTTVGAPLPPVEVRIARARSDGVGEILVRSPAAMTTYLGDTSVGPLDARGWLRTGDLGFMRDGLLYLAGRDKDIIIRGGENILASRVESILLSIPVITEAAVVGIPDEDLGERVGAVVVVAEGATITAEELIEIIRPQLSYFEVPEQWSVSGTPLPTNNAGKVNKAQARNRLMVG
ncbi:MAG: class I adenylate-forming enzyme family protein [Candidatus Dormiibacterota bacterium]